MAHGAVGTIWGSLEVGSERRSRRDRDGEKVRLLDPGEHVPLSLQTGMEAYPQVPREWVWVAKQGPDIVASLYTAPVYGMVFLMRLNASPAATPTSIRHLLGEALRQLKSRGYTQFFSFLDGSRVEELKLARIAQRYGAALIPAAGFWVAGSIK